MTFTGLSDSAAKETKKAWMKTTAIIISFLVFNSKKEVQ